MTFKIFKITLLAGLLIMPISQKAEAQNTAALTDRQKHIVTVAAFTANGDLNALKAEFPKALESSLTVNEIKEVLIQMYAYAGFPRSLNGINTFIEVLDERQKQGIEDPAGTDISPLPDDTDMNAYGNNVRNELTGRDLSENPAPWAKFAPVIDEYLKENLFGELFARDILNYQERELATIGALAAMEGAEAQLAAHLNFSLNVGLSEEQLYDFVNVLQANLGADAAEKAQALLDEITSTAGTNP